MVYLKKKFPPNSELRTPEGITNVDFYMHKICFKVYLEVADCFSQQNTARNTSLHHFVNHIDI